MSPADPVTDLRDHLDVLGEAWETWQHRDDTQADPEARRAGHTAVMAIDHMLGGMYSVRAQLVAEIRASDDASDARADAMIRKYREADDAPP